MLSIFHVDDWPISTSSLVKCLFKSLLCNWVVCLLNSGGGGLVVFFFNLYFVFQLYGSITDIKL